MINRYNYLDDVPASPQELEGLRDSAQGYLERYGEFCWGSNDTGEFYGFNSDEHGIDEVPVVGYDSVPTFKERLWLPDVRRIIPATAVLALDSVCYIDLTFTDASQMSDPEDGDDPIEDWNLSLNIFVGKPANPKFAHALDIYDVYDDDDDEAYISSSISRNSGATDLMRTEWQTLQRLVDGMAVYRSRQHRRPQT